jgi:type I restriction enzyme R subunit
MSRYTQDHLIEQPAIQLLEHELGWNSVNAFDEWSPGISSLGRETKREVVLTSRLEPALQSLNPELPAEALDAAVEELTRDRSALSLVEANREIDKLLRGGVKWRGSSIGTIRRRTISCWSRSSGSAATSTRGGPT